MANTYCIKTFLRYDDGDGNITYVHFDTSKKFMRNAEFAVKLAKSIANNDSSLIECLKVTDGYAVVVYEDGKPFWSFEHDGIRINDYRGHEIAEQLWN